MRTYPYKLILLVILLLGFLYSYAQVTVGSGKTPNKGTLLHLKEKDGIGQEPNSVRGLLMPRVKLIAETATGNNLTSTISGTPAETWNVLNHTGLWVYNTNTIVGTNICPGLYYWDGSKWQRMHEQCCTIFGITSYTDGARCGAGSVQLIVVGTIGTATLKMYTAATGGTEITTGSYTVSGNTYTYTTPSISTTTTYYAELGNSKCASTRQAVTATINAIPTITATTPVARCGAGTVTLTATASSGATVRWYTVATGGTPTTGASYTTASIAAGSSTTYYVEAYNATTGCVSARKAIVATANAIPTITTTTPVARCGAGTVTLTATASSGATVRWYTVATGGTPTTGASYTTASIAAGSSTTYYVEAYNATTGCVSARKAVVATANAIPTITTTTPVARCGAGTVTLTATASSGATVRWYTVATGGTPTTGASYTTASIAAGSSTTYYVEAYNATTGCVSARKAVVATANVLPAITATTPGCVTGTGTATLVITGTAGATLKMYTVATGGTAITTGSYTVSGGTYTYTTPSISATTTYYAELTVGTCVSARKAVVATVAPLPAINLTTTNENNLIHLPSGKDLRTFPTNGAATLSFTWTNPANGALKITSADLAPSNGLEGGLKFTLNPPTGWTNPTTSPASFNYRIQDMSDIITSDNPATSNPFRSRETVVALETAANACGVTTKVDVRLNQTNYRLTFKRDNATLNSSGYRLRDSSPKFTSTKVHYYRFLMMPAYDGSHISRFQEESNATWKAAYEQKTAGILAANIVPTNIPATGGQNLTNGTSILNTRYPAYISSDTDKNRQKTAGILTYTDAAATPRFYPVEIHFVQCASKGFDDSGITDVGRSTNSASWGTKVLKHTDQSGNPFYSASFGTAGRWMTTNLAATKYDTGSPLAGQNLEAYETIDLLSHEVGKKKYAYPILDATMIPGSLPDAEKQKPGSHWDNVDWSVKGAGWRPEEGIFYNWYAATGRGYGDNTNTQEGANGGEPTKVQGICPQGWHIPTDRECNELEKVVNGNIGDYATYDAVDMSTWGAPAWTASWDTFKGNRGNSLENEHIGHGAAMKDICPPTGSDAYINAYSYLQGSKNYSKELYLGGFNATLVGRIKANKDVDSDPYQTKMIHLARGYNANYWTNSQNSMGDAWLRDFNGANAKVNRTTYVKTHLLSVRCKKD